ncbi:BCCT family transporter [Nitrosomonas sp. Nm51]|uniref:BCCT family transporter n=1 Tax=Nitrosomonas sp. Nm51 TaxID=133720 RepID=UPI00115FC9F2
MKIKLIWDVTLGALGVVMILSDSMETVRAIIALGTMPFVYILLLPMVCLLNNLKPEARCADR